MRELIHRQTHTVKHYLAIAIAFVITALIGFVWFTSTFNPEAIAKRSGQLDSETQSSIAQDIQDTFAGVSDVLSDQLSASVGFSDDEAPF